MRHASPLTLRTLSLLLAAAFAAVVLAACRTGSGGSGPTPTPGTTLDDGGVVITDEGVAVGATEGALDAPVELDVAVLAEPPALPGGWSFAGSAYTVGAAERVVVEPGTPLLVGLPLPVDADPATVAVAAHVPELAFEQNGGETTERAWVAVDSVYDAERRLVYTPVYGLDEGAPYALVTGSDAEPPVGSGAPTLRAQAETAGRFGAVCRRFESGECGAAVERQVAERARAFRRAFSVDRGFAEPGLRPLVADIEISLVPPRVGATVARYALQIRPADTNVCDDKNGSYNSLLGRFVICKERGVATFDDQFLQVVDHEVFHAVQFQYLETLTDFIAPRNRWVVEATATAIERSRASGAGDRDRFTRDVDVALTRQEATQFDGDVVGDVAYQSQDLWTFIANRYGRDISYLRAVLRNGLSLDDIDETLRSEFGDGLADVYWDWAKNQAFETRVDIGFRPPADDGSLTPLLNDPCVFNPAALLNGDDGVIDLTYVRGSGVQFGGRIGLAPLSSRVLRFTLEPDSEAYVAELRLGGEESTFPAKFYSDHGSGTEACWAEPDGRTARFGVEAGQARTVWALVANPELLAFQQTDEDGNDDLRFFVSGRDLGGVEAAFTAPSETGGLPEGEITTFELDVSTPSGSWTTDWFVDDMRRNAGGASSFGARLCPGQHTVRALVRDGEFGIEREAEITVEMVNTAPVVEILAPVPAAVGEGEPFTLRGSVVDPTCEDPNGDQEVEALDFDWTVEDGVPATTFGATLLTQFAGETAGSATRTVALAYEDRGSPRRSGSASVEIDVTAPAPGGYPPQVAIQAPQDGLEFVGAPSVALDFRGIASGGLTGDLVWEARRSDGSGWTAWSEFGRGGSVSGATFSNDDCDGRNCITTVQVRLRLDGYGLDPLQTLEFSLYLAG